MKKLVIAILSFFILPAAAWADMGQIHASDVQVAEDSQKAIILHNFNEEILILGTDLKAEKTNRDYPVHSVSRRTFRGSGQRRSLQGGHRID